MPAWRVRLIALATTFACFWTLIHVERPGSVSSEYLAIVVWTVPLALFAAGVTPSLRRRLAGRRVGVRPLALAVMAVVSAVAWTFAAVALTGGYALAFDANPLWCWTAGALAGIFAAVCWPARRGQQSISPAA